MTGVYQPFQIIQDSDSITHFLHEGLITNLRICTAPFIHTSTITIWTDQQSTDEWAQALDIILSAGTINKVILVSALPSRSATMLFEKLIFYNIKRCVIYQERYTLVPKLYDYIPTSTYLIMFCRLNFNVKRSILDHEPWHKLQISENNIAEIDELLRTVRCYHLTLEIIAIPLERLASILECNTYLTTFKLLVESINIDSNYIINNILRNNPHIYEFKVNNLSYVDQQKIISNRKRNCKNWYSYLYHLTSQYPLDCTQMDKHALYGYTLKQTKYNTPFESFDLDISAIIKYSRPSTELDTHLIWTEVVSNLVQRLPDLEVAEILQPISQHAALTSGRLAFADSASLIELITRFGIYEDNNINYVVYHEKVINELFHLISQIPEHDWLYTLAPDQILTVFLFRSVYLPSLEKMTKVITILKQYKILTDELEEWILQLNTNGYYNLIDNPLI